MAPDGVLDPKGESMKVLRLLILLAVSNLAFAQTPNHSVQLSWTASTDTGGTVNVYRAPGSCSGTFTQLKTGVAAAGPYTDTTVTVGTFAYQVTAVVGGAESKPSNCVVASILPAAPTVLVIVTTN